MMSYVHNVTMSCFVFSLLNVEKHLGLINSACVCTCVPSVVSLVKHSRGSVLTCV